VRGEGRRPRSERRGVPPAWVPLVGLLCIAGTWLTGCAGTSLTDRARAGGSPRGGKPDPSRLSEASYAAPATRGLVLSLRAGCKPCPYARYQQCPRTAQTSRQCPAPETPHSGQGHQCHSHCFLSLTSRSWSGYIAGEATVRISLGGIPCFRLPPTMWGRVDRSACSKPCATRGPELVQRLLTNHKIIR
jgi:hypothetical protein